jgi:glycosyltransferase involved in cell wall biosynthesis
MFRSILVIAHNEADHIGECLESLARQTVIPDEIILVAHNCTDGTAEIARETGKRLGLSIVRVDEWPTEETGPVFARIRAFELARYEIVACIDGDSVAAPDWLEKITVPLARADVSATGGTVRFKNDLLGNLASFWFFDMGRSLSWRHFYFWGANFACKKSAYEKSGGLKPFVRIKQDLGLHFYADDCYLSLAFEKIGDVVTVPKAFVRTYPGKIPNSLDRGMQ